MNLRETILKEHSKANCKRITDWVGDNQSRYDALAELFLHDEPRVTQRAAWPLSEVALKYPQLVKKHLGAFLKNLKRPNLHDAIKRNTIRLLQGLDIPAKYEGEVMNLCFENVVSTAEKPAVKAYSITVLQNLSSKYPEIIPELKTIVETQWDNESAAFKMRAKHLLDQTA